MCVCVLILSILNLIGQMGKWEYILVDHVHELPSGDCVCVCVFIKLHITAQSGPVILVILCHSH